MMGMITEVVKTPVFVGQEMFHSAQTNPIFDGNLMAAGF